MVVMSIIIKNYHQHKYLCFKMKGIENPKIKNLQNRNYTFGVFAKTITTLAFNPTVPHRKYDGEHMPRTEN